MASGDRSELYMAIGPQGPDAPPAALLTPERLWTASDVLTRPSPVPAAAGVYAWYFDALPGAAPAAGCQRHDGLTLLYIGISPKAPPRDGRPGSRQTLRSRVRYHFRGNAYGSTLRLTLGCLLAEELGIELRRVGSGTRLTFGKAGEATLSAWMAAHARVAWVTHPRPWELEHELIQTMDLPLNLDQNRHHAFHHTLSALRASQRTRARALPITS